MAMMMTKATTTLMIAWPCLRFLRTCRMSASRAITMMSANLAGEKAKHVLPDHQQRQQEIAMMTKMKYPSLPHPFPSPITMTTIPFSMGTEKQWMGDCCQQSQKQHVWPPPVRRMQRQQRRQQFITDLLLQCLCSKGCQQRMELTRLSTSSTKATTIFPKPFTFSHGHGRWEMGTYYPSKNHHKTTMVATIEILAWPPLDVQHCYQIFSLPVGIGWSPPLFQMHTWWGWHWLVPLCPWQP